MSVWSQPGCWNLLKVPRWSLQLRWEPLIYLLARAGPVGVITYFHLRMELEFRSLSFQPFPDPKRRPSHLVVWRCLVTCPMMISTTLGINWKATSSNHIVTKLLVTEKASVLDTLCVTENCFLWHVTLRASIQLRPSWEGHLASAPGLDKIPESSFPVQRFSFHLTCFSNSNSPLLKPTAV